MDDCILSILRERHDEMVEYVEECSDEDFRDKDRIEDFVSKINAIRVFLGSEEYSVDYNYRGDEPRLVNKIRVRIK